MGVFTPREKREIGKILSMELTAEKRWEIPLTIVSVTVAFGCLITALYLKDLSNLMTVAILLMAAGATRNEKRHHQRIIQKLARRVPCGDEIGVGDLNSLQSVDMRNRAIIMVIVALIVGCGVFNLVMK